jgi:protease YdgD
MNKFLKLLSLFVVGVLAQQTAGLADGSALRKLLTADEARAWRAVGRLNIGKNSFCTGTLVAPDLVLTAAHCLYDPDTGQPVDSDQIEFLAGWRNGQAVAYRMARRFVVCRQAVAMPPFWTRRLRPGTRARGRRPGTCPMTKAQTWK